MSSSLIESLISSENITPIGNICLVVLGKKTIYVTTGEVFQQPEWNKEAEYWAITKGKIVGLPVFHDPKEDLTNFEIIWFVEETRSEALIYREISLGRLSFPEPYKDVIINMLLGNPNNAEDILLQGAKDYIALKRRQYDSCIVNPLDFRKTLEADELRFIEEMEILHPLESTHDFSNSNGEFPVEYMSYKIGESLEERITRLRSLPAGYVNDTYTNWIDQVCLVAMEKKSICETHDEPLRPDQWDMDAEDWALIIGRVCSLPNPSMYGSLQLGDVVWFREDTRADALIFLSRKHFEGISNDIYLGVLLGYADELIIDLVVRAEIGYDMEQAKKIYPDVQFENGYPVAKSVYHYEYIQDLIRNTQERINMMKEYIQQERKEIM